MDNAINYSTFYTVPPLRWCTHSPGTKLNGQIQDMRLSLRRIGQIERANIRFGDLTVFVGPQASGKSIALQMLRLVVDPGFVQHELRRHGIDWQRRLPEFLDVYFGGGMHSLWRPGRSRVTWNGAAIDLENIAARRRRGKSETLFFIPAQRVLALREGWPRPFTDYSAEDPFSVRQFSEELRLLLEQEFKDQDNLYPQERRLKRQYRELLQKTVFRNFLLGVDRSQRQKRLVLGARKAQLPYMVWSAGQREFVPLLLGLYWLMPPTKNSTRGDITWVVIEELEMGLHPKAINVVLLLVFELLHRGYRVCISTHSPQVLEAIWAMNILRRERATPKALLEILEAEPSQSMNLVAERALSKRCRVYYFGHNGIARDISHLEEEEELDAGWGGLVSFSERANATVARVVAAKKQASGSK